MKYLKVFENNNVEENILFMPSGEIIDISTKDIDKLNQYIVLDYNYDYNLYIIEDDYKDIITMILNGK